MSANAGVVQFEPVERFELGPTLLQLAVGEIDDRANAKPGDVIATLAFIAGRVIQRNAFMEEPQGFRLDQSSNGIAFLRSDFVSNQLLSIKAGTFACKLLESTILAGVRRFPDFNVVRENAHEAMTRRAACYLPENSVSTAPSILVTNIQTDIDAILEDGDDRLALTSGVFDACGLAIGYMRHRLEPAQAAELAMSVAMYAGWLDQRKPGTR